MSHVVDSPPLFVQIGFVSAASDGTVAEIPKDSTKIDLGAPSQQQANNNSERSR